MNDKLKPHRHFLLDLLSRDLRWWRPTELDEQIFGHMRNPFDLLLGTGRSPFDEALGELVRDGRVIAEQDADGWRYHFNANDQLA